MVGVAAHHLTKVGVAAHHWMEADLHLTVVMNHKEEGAVGLGHLVVPASLEGHLLQPSQQVELVLVQELLAAVELGQRWIQLAQAHLAAPEPGIDKEALALHELSMGSYPVRTK